MTEKLKLMSVLAHPDDESLGMGGTLARYADQGVETYLICATRGERGRFGDAVERPPIDVVGRVREGELRAAVRELGIKELSLLDYIDADLDKADPEEAIAKIAGHIRRVRPHVITTFGPDGAYGHPDHIAISQFTIAACICAADAGYSGSSGVHVSDPPHRVDKLYYMVWTPEKMEAYKSAFRDVRIKVDGKERSSAPWPEWAITTVIETELYWPQVWRAIQCHQTQLTIYKKLNELSDQHHRQLWGYQEFIRVYSTVNGGRRVETDLFEGLYSRAQSQVAEDSFQERSEAHGSHPER